MLLQGNNDIPHPLNDPHIYSRISFYCCWFPAPTVEANWAQVGQVIRGSKNSSEEKFGWSVSVSSFKAVLAVGAPYERDVGVVHTYKYDEFARMWDHIGVLEGDKVGCEFGNSTALSAEGDFLAIGARNHYDGRGQVRVYKMSNGTWELVGQPLSGKLPDDNFGNAVSLSASGLVLGVSAASVDKTGVGVNSGLVHVFWYDIVNKLWRPRGPDLSGVGAFDRFGFSMVLSGDGDVVAIGAPFHGQKRTLTGGITTIDWGGQVRAYRYHPNADKWIPMGDPILNRTANERSGWAIDLSAKMARSSLSGPR